jgi:serine/threonine protein kinase
VLIDDEKRARIGDFGLTVILPGGKTKYTQEKTGYTTDTSHTGTVRYLAPELLDAEEHVIPTPKSDVYALGCLALEVRTSTSSFSLINLHSNYRRSFFSSSRHMQVPQSSKTYIAISKKGSDRPRLCQ